MKVLKAAVANQRWDLVAHALVIGLVRAEQLCSTERTLSAGPSTSSRQGESPPETGHRSGREVRGRTLCRHKGEKQAKG